MLALHRMRSQLMKFRTMQMNGLRGLLAEYGEVMARGVNTFEAQTSEIEFVKHFLCLGKYQGDAPTLRLSSGTRGFRRRG